MLVFLPFVLYLSIHFEIDLPRPLTPWADRLQVKCVEIFAHPTNPDDLSSSFICGKKISQKKHKHWLQKSGVYHAIVVSGGHFLFIEAVLKRLALPAGLRFILLFVYYLMTGLQAPGLRCLVQMGLKSSTERFNLKTSPTALCFFSGLICLSISFPLWNSLSFWLSFVVSLSLCFTEGFISLPYRSARWALSLFFIYLFLIPFNYSSGYLHPLNLVLGVLLLHPFCLVLLASAALVVLGRLFESAWVFELSRGITSRLYWVLEHSTVLVPDKNKGHLSLFSFWIYALILIALLYLTTLHFRRETIRE